MAFTFLLVVEEHALSALRGFKSWLQGRHDRLILYSGMRDPEADNLTVLEAQDAFHDERGTWDKVTCIVESNVDPRNRAIELATSLGVDIVVCAANDDASLLMRSLRWGTSEYALYNCPNQAVLIIHKLRLERECRYLLCVDGSQQCRRAAELLSRLAMPEDFVAVYSAYDPPTRMAVAGRTLMKNPRHEAECQERHALALHHANAAQALLERNAPGLPLEVQCFVEASEDPSKSAVDFAASHGIHIIVCGSRGLGTIRRLVFSSFSTHVAVHAKEHTVMVVH
eukprot:GGOE01018322.1.p1 GENE.GGOE01018322.1~~GGOE01018322.1.p1  ORF type:complete len:283 (-),score=76.67 GGOE01018322.1:209-1057(-)